LLASPIRKMIQDPDKILTPYVEPGMWILEIGPGMGFFSLPLARLVGDKGRVVCIDLQEKMIQGLMKRAWKSGFSERIIARTCTSTSLQVEDLPAKFDFALAFAVIHEVPDVANLFSEIFAALRKGGSLLISEPTGHVTESGFRQTLSVARSIGFLETESPSIRSSLARVLVKV
jgi:2-polyprenyl-3-methyl-5-hydroxy-6-metoxy-1,4-benzoquinol methylase